MPDTDRPTYEKCPYCGSPDRHAPTVHDGYEYVRCATCNGQRPTRYVGHADDLSWVRAAVTVGQVLHLYADMDEAREVLRTGAYNVAAHVDRVELHRGGGEAL